jgi:hypothetical protein
MSAAPAADEHLICSVNLWWLTLGAGVRAGLMVMHGDSNQH